MKSDVRTAVVGCGYWGKNLVRNFAQLSDLRACCDPDPGVQSRLRAQFPNVRVEPEYETLLDAPDIDAFILATPAPLHASMTRAALQRGKHVFVEKPLALTRADAQAMVTDAQQAGLVLMVGHLLEYHPAVNHLKGLMESGELGETYYIYTQRVNLGKVRSNENALWSLAPHDISIVLYLMNETPVKVSASGQAFLQEGIEDIVFVTLHFGSGRVAHVHVSWLDPHKNRTVTVVGSRKMAVFDDMEPTEKVRIYDKGVDRPPTEAPPYESFGELLQLREGDILIPRIATDEPLALECREFLRAVETGRAPRSDGRAGLAVVEVLETAQRALDSQRSRYAAGGQR